MFSKFTQDIISNLDFRSCLIIVVIDKIHFVYNWTNFRSRYFKLYILRTQLFLKNFYLELIAILDSKTLKIIRFTSNFENYRIFKIFIN